MVRQSATLAAIVAALVAPLVGQARPESRFTLVSAIDKDGSAVVGLGADDFVLEEDGQPCEILGASPAAYPIAIVIDTSSFARGGFQQLRDAAHQFAGALSGREVALYTTTAS